VAVADSRGAVVAGSDAAAVVASVVATAEVEVGPGAPGPAAGSRGSPERVAARSASRTIEPSASRGRESTEPSEPAARSGSGVGASRADGAVDLAVEARGSLIAGDAVGPVTEGSRRSEAARCQAAAAHIPARHTTIPATAASSATSP
jgi:hypothetical protein